MADSLVSKDGRVDVERVMSAVRDAVRRRRDEPATSVETAVADRLVDLADESGIDPELLAHLLVADGRWNISPDYRIETHRQGLEARAVVFLKRLLRPFVRLYTDPLVERQAQVNLYLLHAVRSLLIEVTRLQRAVARLEESRDRPAGGGGTSEA
jgi:hypothetical protein